jgi:hypothetical protein
MRMIKITVFLFKQVIGQWPKDTWQMQASIQNENNFQIYGNKNECLFMFSKEHTSQQILRHGVMADTENFRVLDAAHVFVQTCVSLIMF